MQDPLPSALPFRLFAHPRHQEDVVVDAQRHQEHETEPAPIGAIVAPETIKARRAKAGLPDVRRHRTKWVMALEMIDELATWGHRPLALVGDAGYGEITAFRGGLTDRKIPYMVAVKASTTAYPANAVTVMHHSRRGPQPSAACYPDAPNSLKELVVQASRPSLHQVTWRRGTKTTTSNRAASMTFRFTALHIRPANRDIARADDGSLPVEWLLTEWPTGATAPTDYWLSTLPEDTPLKELVRLAKIRRRIEHDYRELKTGLGLAHFERRTFAG